MKPLLNIFTKSSEKIHKQGNHIPIKILADYREKNCLVASYLTSHGIEVEFKELKVADYLVKGVAIERKTISDFISSMLNKRLIKQLEELQQYPEKLLIIEGIEEQELYSDEDYALEKRSTHPNSIRGFLLSILLKYKVPIIFTKNQKDTAIFISLIAKKQNQEMSLRAVKKILSPKEQTLYILEGFPGIGPKTAKKLIKEFKSINKIANTSLEDLRKIIGKKADSFKEIINREFNLN
jgi:ERCC4-type nuclease